MQDGTQCRSLGQMPRGGAAPGLALLSQGPAPHVPPLCCRGCPLADPGLLLQVK